jgi:hypothetical protein
VLVTAIGVRWVGRRAVPLALVFAAFASHLVGDYCGSGAGWPLWPFLPFAGTMVLCEGAWSLSSWQNTTITAVALGLTLWIAVRRGYTPLETFAPATDRVVVGALRLRFSTVPCVACGARAWFHCAACAAPVCDTHGRVARRLARRCQTCAARA